jgi:hypothetical protein
MMHWKYGAIPCPGVMRCAIAALVMCCFAFSMSATADESVTFKAVDFAILKIDERPAKIWDVYLAEKRKNLILIRLGIRYLLLDTEARKVFEIVPEAFDQKGSELLLKEEKERNTAEAQSGRGEDKPLRKLLSSEDWQIKDAGPTLIYRLKLSAEGRVFEVHLRTIPRWMRN